MTPVYRHSMNLPNGKNIRLGWLDYARGVAIILVVYRHVFEGLKRSFENTGDNNPVHSYIQLEHANILFFSFRMPLFFIVSGVFIGSSLAKRGLPQLIKNKMQTILYPYFFWGAIQISLQLFFSGYVNSERTAGDYLYLFYLPREVEQFWYLYALFNVTIIYAAVKATGKVTPALNTFAGLVLFIASAFLSQYKIDLGFVNDILHFYFFFALGDWISTSLRTGKLAAWIQSPILSLMLLPVFVITQYLFLTINLRHQHLDAKFLYVEYYQPLLFLIIALTGCFFVISVSAQLEKYNLLKWLRELGRHSLYIYVMHVIVFAGTRIVLMKGLHIESIPLLLVFCIGAGIIIPVICYRITRRLGWHWVFSLEKDKTGSQNQTAL